MFLKLSVEVDTMQQILQFLSSVVVTIKETFYVNLWTFKTPRERNVFFLATKKLAGCFGELPGRLLNFLR